MTAVQVEPAIIVRSGGGRNFGVRGLSEGALENHTCIMGTTYVLKSLVLIRDLFHKFLRE